jgi:hypothetical protein
MMGNRKTGTWRSEDGREWRIGGDAEVAWIEENTPSGLKITSAIPPVFEAYATLELPGTGNQPAASTAEEWEQLERDGDRHDVGVLAVLREHSQPQSWWLGYLETGACDLIFDGSRRVSLYADWPYVLVEAGCEQAPAWREDCGKGVLPDLMFPADRSWLLSTLWDDDWTCIGGPRALVDAFLAHPDLRDRVREVDPSIEDATPPGHPAY